MWKFRQTPPGGSIKSISGHALPISYSMWEDFILGMSPMLNSEALRPLKLNPVHSPALLTVESSHSLTHSRLPVINGIDVRCWNVFWPMSTADSREYRLLPSNTTRPNMHKTNTGLQAPAEGANYLCNKKADTFLMWLQRLSVISCLM